MANEENLTMKGKARGLTTEEAQKIGKIGGIKSGEVRRQKAILSKVAKAILDCELSDTQKKNILKKYPVNDDELSHRTIVFIKQLEKAEKGNLKSAKYVAEVSGEMPNKSEVEKETLPPVVNIEIKDNSEVQKEFMKFDT